MAGPHRGSRAGVFASAQSAATERSPRRWICGGVFRRLARPLLLAKFPSFPVEWGSVGGIHAPAWRPALVAEEDGQPRRAGGGERACRWLGCWIAAFLICESRRRSNASSFMELWTILRAQANPEHDDCADSDKHPAPTLQRPTRLTTRAPILIVQKKPFS